MTSTVDATSRGDQATTLYRLYDADRKLLYCIEIERIRTVDQFNDWMRHLRTKFWFQYVDLHADLEHYEVAP